MTYDNNGNMLSSTNSCGTTTYTWDAKNRLTGINGFNANCSPLTASFKYDALGRRIEKTVNGRTIKYLYDGLDTVQEIEGGVVYANYIRTLNIDEPLARIKSDGTIRYYQQDALGSVIALTDEAGAIKTQYKYDPFGNTEIIGEASDNPFQYTGRENDGTGLYYYRARYYSPELQRFISEDLIRLAGGINMYAYVENSPLGYVDPLGLSHCQERCTFGPLQDLGRDYADWIFQFSVVEGPGRGNLLPIYNIKCIWKRKYKVTFGYEIQCLSICTDKCGKIRVNISKGLKTFTFEGGAEQTITGGSFDFTEGWGGSKALSDMICKLRFRPK